MENKYLLLTFDIEEFVCASEFGLDTSKDRAFEVGRNGLLNIMKVLKDNNLKATFFTTLEFAQKNKDLLQQLISNNNEIALHGYNHNTSYHIMPEHQLMEELEMAKRELEEIINKKVRGFRSPQMRKLNSRVLNKLGFAYDSSLHPTFVPGNNQIFKSRKVYRENNVFTVPVSVVPFVRLPFSWIWFRNLGLSYVKMCTSLCLKAKDYINLYFHPWDFYNTTTAEFKGVNKLWLRNSGDNALKELDDYCKWCINKNILPKTISEYLEIDK